MGIRRECAISTAPAAAPSLGETTLSDRDFGVGLIGYGLAGRVFHAPFIATTPGLNLKRVATSRDAEVAAAYPQARIDSDPAALLKDPDIALVVVASPNDSHVPLALRALEAGKAVVVDKPVAPSSAELAQLMAAAKARDGLVIPFHNRRWDGDFLALKRLMAEGVLGKIVGFESRFDRFAPVVRDRWRERPGPASGLLFDLGPHLIDQALHLFGPPRSVFADVSARRPGAQCDDYFHLLLAYPDLHVVLNATTLGGGGPRFLVEGLEGSFAISGLDPQETLLKTGATPGQASQALCADGLLTTWNGEAPVTRAITVPAGDYGAFYRGVADSLAGTAPPPVAAQDALNGLKVIEAAHRSLAMGAPATLA
jgi:predicted dehydrogenase